MYPVVEGKTGKAARILWLLMGGVPAFAGLVAGHPMIAAVLLALCEAVVAIALFTGGILGEVFARRRERIIDWLDQAVLRWLSLFGMRYRDFMMHSLRSIEEQGPATTGFYRPELDEVFVDVSLLLRAPHQVPGGLVAEPPIDTAERRWLGDFLDQPIPQVLAVIGAPGSGKTTLLRRTGREISRSRRGRRRRVPMLLYLRDHVSLIVKNPDITVATLLRRELGRYHISDPGGWFDRKLRAGRCVVLLDGLDEVARQSHRRAVADWVEVQIRQFPRNDFVITSRPQGYLTAKIDGATVLQVRSFNDDQVTSFVRRWYLALEKRSTGEDGEGVRLRAYSAAEDLLDRLNRAPGLYELTVNPLLLTMIANVHRYRGALPGSRVDLYGEICEVMLWRRQEAKKLEVEMRGDKKQVLLRALAFTMMQRRVRDLPRADVLAELAPGLRRMSREFTAEDFLTDVGSNGLLVERESGVYSFAHHTFQEYLAASHIRVKGLSRVLADGVDDVWWRETTLLYAARSDSDEIVRACVDSGSVTALLLAFDCADQYSELAPELREHLENLLDSAFAPETDRVRRHLIAGVLVARHLRNLVRSHGGQRLCPNPITNGIYWLYLQETDGPSPDRPAYVDFARDQRVAGVRGSDALAFLHWVNRNTGSQAAYRLPSRDQLIGTTGSRSVVPPNCAVWVESTGGGAPELWTPPHAEHPHEIDSDTLAEHVGADVNRCIPALTRLLLLQSLIEARMLTLNLEDDLGKVRVKALARSRIRKIDVDLALAKVRARSRERPLNLANALDRVRGLVGEPELVSALEVTRDAVRSIAIAPFRERTAALDRGAVLAKSLVGDLEPELARAFALTGELDDRVTPNRVLGRALSTVFDSLLVSPGLWSARFGEAFLRVTTDAGIDYVVSPDSLAPKANRARKSLIALFNTPDPDDEDEDVDADSGPSAWACRAAVALEQLATPVFTRRRPLTADTATAIRLAALCLSAEVTDPQEERLRTTFRELAAGVTLLQRRASGAATPTETIILATA